MRPKCWRASETKHWASSDAQGLPNAGGGELEGLDNPPIPRHTLNVRQQTIRKEADYGLDHDCCAAYPCRCGNSDPDTEVFGPFAEN